MSAAISSTRVILRQSRPLFRQTRFRNASTTAEVSGKTKEIAAKAAEGAKEQASKVTETAKEQVSKASEGLTRVQSAAGSAASSAVSRIQNMASGVGGRTGRVIRFVESLIPPTMYYGRVGFELGRLMFQHEKMSPPSIASFQQYMTPLTNMVRNPSQITKAMNPEALQSVRNMNSSQLVAYAIIAAQVLGFFTVGEMIGRMKIVGYHGEVHHEEH